MFEMLWLYYSFVLSVFDSGGVDFVYSAHCGSSSVQESGDTWIIDWMFDWFSKRKSNNMFNTYYVPHAQLCVQTNLFLHEM